jgi:iron complex transport system ATP-binding protein
MGSPYFELQAIEAWLGSRAVFSDLSLRLDLGEHAVLLGPNGSGKTSLIRLLCRELYPVVKPGSTLRIFGSEQVNLWQLRRRLGLLSSDLEGRHHPGLRGVDVVLAGFFGSIGLGPHLQPTARQRKRVAQLMAELQVHPLAQRRFGELSSGERRRLLLARALVHQPEVLVLDEPTNGLDLRSRHQLLDLLRQLAGGGTTLLLVTHQIEAIVPEISRVLMMRQGRLIGDGSAQELLQSQQLSTLFDTPLRLISHQGWHQVLPG